MKKRIWMLLLLCGALNLAAIELASAPTPEELVRASATATLKAYPDSDTVRISDLTRLAYQPDGSYKYVCEVALKILTEKGREESSSVTLSYDAAYGSTRFLRADVIKPNGTVVAVDLEKQVHETIDSGQMNQNIYNPNSKRIFLSVPGLEPGDLLRYTFSGGHSKPVVPNTWSDLFLFEDTSPILHSVCRIDAPAERPLTRIELKDPVGDTVSYRNIERPDGGTSHIWEARNVPRMFPEPAMPARHTESQRILLSTIPDWETLSSWYRDLSQPRLNAVNDAMKTKVKELTTGLTDRQKKIEAIFRFVSQEIRYMGITMEDEAPGYEPHDVCLTFDNRYGVCRDKAALLVAMFRLAGFDAYPVLIYVGPKKEPDVPQPWFNHAITAIHDPGGSWQLMDPTNENTRDLLPAYLCNRSYLVAHPDGDRLRTSPVIPPEDNQLTIQIEGELDDSNCITATARLSFGGINDTAYRGRLAGLKPEERKPYFETRLKKALGAARLTRLKIVPADVRDTTVPLSVVIGFEADNTVVNGAEEAILRVPTLINHFGLFGALLGEGVGLDQREYPLQTQVTCGISETVRLDLTPGSLRPTVMPTYEPIDNPRLLIDRSVTSTGGILRASADLQLRTVEFSPGEYQELKDSLETAEQNARKRVIAEPIGFPQEADYATLDDHVSYEVDAPNTLMRIRTVKQKVLTYAGKKALSDVKIHYNSGFQQTELRFARVTAPDGTVREIDPENEINIMDAPWVAGAPRYPAEKIMVINLPGVEVGSTIAYQVATTCRDIPFFSAMESFDNLNPVVKKTVRVEMSPSVDLNIRNRAPDIIHRRTRRKDGKIIHEWSAENRPMIRKDDHLAPDWVLKPTLLLSTGTMETYAKTVRERLRSAAKPTHSLKAKAKKLTRGVNGRIPKMEALRDFVDRSIREAGPGLSSLPLSAVTSAEQTLAEGYGNRTDRNVLLYALSKASGLTPRFVLSSGLPRIEGINTPLLATLQRRPFNTPLVAIENDKKEFYFGDSGRYATPGTLAHHRNPAIDLDRGETEFPETQHTHRTDTSFKLAIEPNGDLSLHKSTRFSGTAFEAFHKTFAEFTPEELHREEQRQLSNLSQSAQVQTPLTPSFKERTLTLSASLKNYAVVDGDYMYLTLPEGLGNVLNIQSDHRTSAFYIKHPVHTSVRYQITIPKGWRPVLKPRSFKTELPASGGTVRVETESTDDGLVILQDASINPAIVHIKDYDELLDLTDTLTRPAFRTLMLKRTE